MNEDLKFLYHSKGFFLNITIFISVIILKIKITFKTNFNLK